MKLKRWRVRKVAVIWLIAFAIPLFGRVTNGSVISGSYYLTSEKSGVPSNTKEVSFQSQSDFSLFMTDSTAVLTSSQTLSIRADDANLGVRYESFVGGNERTVWGYTGAIAQVAFSDRLTIFANNGQALTPLQIAELGTVTLMFVTEGSVSLASTQEFTLFGEPRPFYARNQSYDLEFSFFAGLQVRNFRFTDRVLGGSATPLQDTKSIAPPAVGLEVNVDSQGKVSYGLGIRAVIDNSGGKMSLDFMNTSALTRIQFADGTTPEDRGYSLVFDSGMRSPNLESATVPEPASIAIWSFSVFVISVLSCHRRKSPLPHLDCPCRQ